MSKMVAPKMDVVRFQESDVIVASGVYKTFELTGLGDNVANNAAIGYKGTSYALIDDKARSNFFTAFNLQNKTNINDDTGVYIYPPEVEPQGTTNFRQLDTWDAHGSGSSIFNGIYEWDGTIFRHQ